MQTPSIHEVIVGMEQYGMKPKCLLITCTAEGCDEVAIVTMREPVTVDEYLADCCKTHGWDDEDILCARHKLKKLEDGAWHDAEVAAADNE